MYHRKATTSLAGTAAALMSVGFLLSFVTGSVVAGMLMTVAVAAAAVISSPLAAPSSPHDKSQGLRARDVPRRPHPVPPLRNRSAVGKREPKLPRGALHRRQGAV